MLATVLPIFIERFRVVSSMPLPHVGHFPKRKKLGESCSDLVQLAHIHDTSCYRQNHVVVLVIEDFTINFNSNRLPL